MENTENVTVQTIERWDSDEEGSQFLVSFNDEAIKLLTQISDRHEECRAETLQRLLEAHVSLERADIYTGNGE